MKIKINLFFFSFLFFTPFMYSQTLIWAKGYGNNALGDESSASVAVDAAGNVYTTGYFWGTMDFDPGAGTFNLTSAGNSDIFVQKLDASGNFVWAGRIGGLADENGNAIALDASGNIYITGMISTMADMDPGTSTVNAITSSGSYDAFVEKLSGSGAFVWAKLMGGSGSDEGFGITIDASGNIYSTGDFTSSGDFNPGSGTTTLSSAGGSDIYVQKLDNTGAFVWAKSFGGAGSDRGNSIAVDGSGNVITTGYFEVICDFDPGLGVSNLTTNGLKDVFINKLDATGNFSWVKQMGGAADDIGNSVVVDASGNVYSTGEFSAIVDFDPGAGTTSFTSAGLKDIYVSKLDIIGNFGWAKQMGAGSDDIGNDIHFVSSCVFTTGRFSGTADFNPGSGTANLSSAGGSDVFVQKLDASGNYLLSAAFGGSNSDEAFSLFVDGSGNIHTTGVFEGTADCDPSPGTYTITSSGTSDNFVHKMDQSITTSISDYFIPNILVYPNPSEGTFFVDLGKKYSEVKIEVFNVLGEIVFSSNSTNTNTEEILLHEYTDGIYFVNILTNDRQSVIKLIKK